MICIQKMSIPLKMNFLAILPCIMICLITGNCVHISAKETVAFFKLKNGIQGKYITK